MGELLKVRKFYQLKNVERANSVGIRKESPAEHTWSCLILADYFLEKTKMNIDKSKVFDLLLYHDVVEIECGDENIFHEQEHAVHKKNERSAADKLKKDLPLPLQEKFLALFVDFEEGKTVEARFAKAIDALDAVIHELDYPDDWKGWTEEFLRRKKSPLFETFPELKEMFDHAILFAQNEKYFK